MLSVRMSVFVSTCMYACMLVCACMYGLEIQCVHVYMCVRAWVLVSMGAYMQRNVRDLVMRVELFICFA